MKNMFLVFSHQLTESQIKEAKERLQVTSFINLPEKLQEKWSNIPPDFSNLKEYLNEIMVWLKSQGKPGDYILVQGDFGAVYLLVSFSKKIGLIPVYSTTRREVKETVLSNGKVEVARIFSHVRFRGFAEYD